MHLIFFKPGSINVNVVQAAKDVKLDHHIEAEKVRNKFGKTPFTSLVRVKNVMRLKLPEIWEENNSSEGLRQTACRKGGCRKIV